MNEINKHRVIIIINPISGVRHKNLNDYKRIVESTLDLDYFIPECFVTEYAGHAVEISTRGLASGVRYFLVAGGDGTVNEVASLLTGTDAVMGILPAGSGNGLAHHLEIPGRIAEAVSVINKRKIIAIDTCLVNDVFFVSIAGIGFDAKVARQFARSKRRGFMTYAGIVFKEYFQYKPGEYLLRLDGKKIKTTAFFISFANSSQFGYNTRIAPGASITDGLIDVCIVKKPPVGALLRITHLLMRRRIDQSRYLEIIPASSIYVKRKKGKRVNVDGEAVIMKKELNVEIRPASLKMLVP
ncbi:MAG: diacylglycerol kinase family protein [Bacteroidota bacterium]